VYRVSRRVAQTLRIEPLQREINLHLSGYRFEWQYSVIGSDRINAFCLPGGKIGVFTGLLQALRHLHGALDLETIEARPVFDGDEIKDLEADNRNRATTYLLQGGPVSITARRVGLHV
jgi:Peptidase family M48